MTIAIDRMRTICQWCFEAYLQHAGRRLGFPKDTDPTKTYQWRYVEALAKRLRDWQFDDELSKKFIEIAIKYAKKHSLLNKGLSIFLQKNLLEVCHKQIVDAHAAGCSVLEQLRRVSSWLRDQAGAAPLRDVLLARRGMGSYCNLVRWYQSNELPEAYLALSRSCGQAIRRLATARPQERLLLPKDSRLFILNMNLTSDQDVRHQARAILHDDWRQQCP